MTEQNEIEEMAKVLSTLPLCEIRGARPHTNEYVDSDFCPNCGARMKGDEGK